MKMFSMFFMAALLSGCAAGLPPSNDNAIVGPVVEGKLAGSTDIHYLPFSADTAKVPTIATEGFAMPRLGATISAPVNLNGIAGANKLWLSRYNSGSKHTDATTDLTSGSQYIVVGGREYGLNSYRGIGIGYVGDSSEIAPVFVGAFEKNTTGSTNADFVIATRSETTNTPPTVRLSVTNIGQIVADTAYVPATDEALTTKKYVDGLIKTLQDKLDALGK